MKKFSKFITVHKNELYCSQSLYTQIYLQLRDLSALFSIETAFCCTEILAFSCNTVKNLGRGKLALIIMEHVNTFQLKQVLLFKTRLMFGFRGFFVFYFLGGDRNSCVGMDFFVNFV